MIIMPMSIFFSAGSVVRYSFVIYSLARASQFLMLTAAVTDVDDDEEDVEKLFKAHVIT